MASGVGVGFDARGADVVEGGVDLVHHEEGRRPELVDGKEQRERREGALAAREVGPG